MYIYLKVKKKKTELIRYVINNTYFRLICRVRSEEGKY